MNPDETAGAEATAEPTPPAAAERTVDVRPVVTVFPFLCVVVLGLASFGVHLATGGSLDAHWWGTPLLLAAAATGMGLLEWLMQSLIRPIQLDQTGISRGRRHMAWKELTGIRVGMARIITLYGGPRKRFQMPGHRNIYREVLPEVALRRPDLALPPVLRRRMDHPKSLDRIPALALAALGCLAVLCASMPYIIRQMPPRMPGLLMFFLPALLGGCVVLAAGVASTAAKHLVGTCGTQSVILVPLILLPLISSVHPVAWDGIFLGLAAFMAAGLLAGLGVRLTWAFKAAALLAMVAVPAGVYAYHAPHVLKREDVTSLTGTDRSLGSMVWSDDGRYCIDFVPQPETQRHLLLDLRDRTSTPLPPRKCSVRAVAHGLVVRMAFSPETEQKELCVYRIDQGREVVPASGTTIAVGGAECISPGGLVCWQDQTAPPNEMLLRLWDPRTEERTSMKATAPQAEVQWRNWRWNGPDELAAVAVAPRASQDKDPTTLHVIRVRRGQTGQEAWASPLTLAMWRVSPDGNHAFGLDEKRGVVYLNLRTGQTKDLGGQNVPVWSGDSGSGYRVDTPPAASLPGPAFGRFDAQKLTESWTSLPEGTKVVSLSPDGRWAILDHSRVIRPAILMNLTTGPTHHLPVSPIGSMLMGRGDWTASWGVHTLWAPDSRSFLLPDLAWRDGQARLFLYRLP